MATVLKSTDFSHLLDIRLTIQKLYLIKYIYEKNKITSKNKVLYAESVINGLLAESQYGFYS